MASELRWILLALSVLLLIGIWAWGVRRSRRSPGDAHLRESHLGPTVMGPTVMGGSAAGSGGKEPTLGEAPPPPDSDVVDSRDWGIPPFEPLSIRTADFDHVQLPDLPMSATAAPLDATFTMEADADAIPAPPAAVVVRGDALAAGGEAVVTRAADPAPAPAPAPNTTDTQRIVTIRVCAVGEAHWPGADLLAALESNGLGYGRYKVFHRKHSDGRTLFCAASLVEPGSFDIARMPVTEFRGLTLFAVLPGPADAVETVDTLIATAVDLADTLHGAVQDANGAPLSAQRAEALREDIARFQKSLLMS